MKFNGYEYTENLLIEVLHLAKWIELFQMAHLFSDCTWSMCIRPGQMSVMSEAIDPKYKINSYEFAAAAAAATGRRIQDVYKGSVLLKRPTIFFIGKFSIRHSAFNRHLIRECLMNPSNIICIVRASRLNIYFAEMKSIIVHRFGSFHI